MTTEETEEYTLKYQDDQTAKDKAFAILLKWFKKHERFCGESIQQSDITCETAPDLLSDIAEKAFKFKRKWKEEA